MDGTGQKGEDFAAGALADAGMEILCRNYKKRWGEIDIIAKDGEYLAFVEVKTRRAGSLVSPLSAVTLQKQRRVNCYGIRFFAGPSLRSSAQV